MFGKFLFRCALPRHSSVSTARQAVRMFAGESSSSGSKSSGTDDIKDNETKPMQGGIRKVASAPKKPKPIDVIDEKILDAVNDVTVELHKDDAEMKKKTRNELIAKLTEHEKETFDAATESQVNEMLSDKSVISLLSGVSTSKTRVGSSFAAMRSARRGMVLLRREVFYQAKQKGFTAEKAHQIAERAVASAEEKVLGSIKEEGEKRRKEAKEEEAELAKRNEDEQKLFDYALKMAEEMLYGSEAERGRRFQQPFMTIKPDTSIKNIFSLDGPRLNIFNEENLKRSKRHSLQFWADWEANAARIWNQSCGPRNGFEEMIELTEKGKMWPYPINNEYLLGEEENVGFHEHIFLEKTLSQYNLPKTGPVAHFMELVCVGLSKNPYMTVRKKREHLEWFANYFNEKKVAEIEKLHKEEIAAASNL